jgi:hypothetical protein
MALRPIELPRLRALLSAGGGQRAQNMNASPAPANVTLARLVSRASSNGGNQGAGAGAGPRAIPGPCPCKPGLIARKPGQVPL